MTGIPSHLFNSLREALADCEQFESNRSLRAVFIHEYLKPWQNNLPQADALTSRVDAVISFLYEKRRRDGSNALVLLLRVLSSQIDPGDERHHRLATLADELESALGENPPASNPTQKTDPTDSSISDKAELETELQGIESALDELESERDKGMIDIGRYLRLKQEYETRKAKLKQE